jgi:hypothetical protein
MGSGALFMLRAPEHKTKAAHSDNEELQWVPLDRKPNNELERIYTGAGWKLTRCQIRSQFGRTA